MLLTSRFGGPLDAVGGGDPVVDGRELVLGDVGLAKEMRKLAIVAAAEFVAKAEVQAERG